MTEIEIKELIKKIDYETSGYSTTHHRMKHKDIPELLSHGQSLLKPIYDVIDECSLVCIPLVQSIVKSPIFINSIVIKNGVCSMNVKLAVSEYKDWFRLNCLNSI